MNPDHFVDLNVYVAQRLDLSGWQACRKRRGWNSKERPGAGHRSTRTMSPEGEFYSCTANAVSFDPLDLEIEVKDSTSCQVVW